MPDAPPLTEAETLARLRLARSRRVGATTFHRLLAEHGSAAAALAALPEIARAAGAEGYAPCPEGVARAELAAGRRAGARLLSFAAPGYPAALADLDDAPPLLWALGDPALAARPMIALVGARNASSLGLRMAQRLAQELGAAGFTVVSGLARGIDAAAHEAALASGTIGVQAGGIDVIYPAENTALSARMAGQGLRLAELPPGTQPQARHFPQRNRIIAGLARATVVIEAAARSGSLLTARNALDYGREVMAVPGHPMDARAAGCNLLLRDGALLVRGAEDVIEALGAVMSAPRPARPMPPAAAKSPPPGPAATDAPARVLAALGPSPTPEDALLRTLGLEAPVLAQVLVLLELEGQVTRHPGGLFSLG
ncbi:DNA-processing protein DprA [Sinirhodobacter huangdaonensis]|uniref:DNA-protecting protein DprA n=1 Tax=Paenirhodobacter huangdaonensis TaxID=2501515 RepID=A0A443M0S5_9RHOB|nr:DNA-processing protein DprA [Sinirhodobacter huangdaonensis]RWR55061.1 DNA-protecting protein DprA [Sinirhodobacter huangdaonensis]